VIRAVLWDFGGVILSSPFEAFNRFESDRGLPLDFIRSVNATNPDDNAWARLERSDIDAEQFDVAFSNESEALGHRVRGSEVLALLAGDIRPAMVSALRQVKSAGFATACLTNNILGTSTDLGVHRSTQLAERSDRQREIDDVMALFDQVVESSRVGVRKPEIRFYEIACESLRVQPDECVFLDDLGVNLKPAAAMGMTTIKVVDPQMALARLGEVIGLDLLDHDIGAAP
jgi:putative hydrolase of the HAD superfamily